MIEKLDAKLKELSEQKEQAIAQLNAIIGAEQAISALRHELLGEEDKKEVDENG